MKKYKDKYSNYTNKIKERGKTLTENGDISFQSKADLINEDYGAKIHKTTVWRHQKDKTPEYLKQKEEKTTKFIKKNPDYLSGILNYDEQWIYIDSELYYRLQKIDSKNKYAYKSLILHHTEFNIETIYNYLNENNHNRPPKVIVTDGYSAYPEIIAKIGAKHSRCHFHYLEFLLKNYWEETKSLKRKTKQTEKKIKYHNNKIEKIREKKKEKKVSNYIKRSSKEKIIIYNSKNKELKNKIKENKDKIQRLDKAKDTIVQLFASQSPEKAKKRFTSVKRRVHYYKKTFPNCTQRITRNWDAITISMENNDIPRTNNLSELYFRTTMPKSRKKTFKTIEGFKQNEEIKRHKWNKKIAKIPL